MGTLKDLKGKSFNYWAVLSDPEYRNKKTKYLCRCICGKEKWLDGYHLKWEDPKSCGCVSRFKHGQSSTKFRSRTYQIWDAMIQRCTNPKNHAAHNYVNRGIKVCDKWMTFTIFLEEMGPAPDGRSIDRIDNNKGYFKENCRWATKLEQVNNTRKTRYCRYNDEIIPIMELVRKTGLKRTALFHRIFKLKMSPEDAVADCLKYSHTRIGVKNRIGNPKLIKAGERAPHHRQMARYLA
jgi:hypothetical protein